MECAPWLGLDLSFHLGLTSRPDSSATTERKRGELGMTRRIAVGIFVLVAILATATGDSFASSEFIQGRFSEIDPDGQSFSDRGVCSLITGPRDGLPAHRFVLTVGDQHSPDTAEVRLTGTYTSTDIDRSRDQDITLYPDTLAAEQSVQETLRRQTNDKLAVFRLADLDASIRLVQPDKLLCSVGVTGHLHGSGARQPAEVTIRFGREGLYFPGNTALSSAPARAAVASAAVAAAGSSCPTADLAPLGLAPVPAQCATPQCLANFKGYQWWSSFQFYGDGKFFEGGGFFYNGGLRTVFAPRNVFVDDEGLHFQSATRDLGGGPTAAGAEAVLMFNAADGSEANLGYGDYLVTAKVKTAPSWATLDPNLAFGAFTFERIGNGSTGAVTNPHREIDLAEISRWGWDQTGSCPNTGVAAPLCNGNAQFTLQPYDSNPANLHRYTIRADVDTVTLVMRWHGANQPVTFEQYDGAFTLTTLPAAPASAWTTSADQNQFVPATKCERFHLNLWQGNFAANRTPNPPPKTLPQEVVVTNFEFRAFK
jgi:hypothetical protein